MDDYQKENYYVYVHRDPLNKYKVMYVGMGRRDRAWHCRGSQRRESHSLWLEALLDEYGYTMDQIAKIEVAALSQEDALAFEKELIAEHRPHYNLPMGCPKKMSNEEVGLAKDLKETGQTYVQLSDVFGVSPMTVWRALNG